MITSGLVFIIILALAVAVISGSRYPRLWLALTLAGAAAMLFAALGSILGFNDWDWHSNQLLGGQRIHLRLDRLSAWFIVLVAFVGAAGAVYSCGYWPDGDKPESAGRGRRWWSALMLSMFLVLLCANGIQFLMAWEAFALSAYFLITLERDRRDVNSAGWLYLAASHAGTLCLFALFCLIAVHTGSWELGPLKDRPELSSLFWIALFGFGVKAGLFPLHIWLPSAHANAPSHVSAIMSGVAIKMGFYGLVRFSGWLPIPQNAGWVVLLLAASSALLGAAFAATQNDLKRLLAYCSVENMGVILTGWGVALLGMAGGSSTLGKAAMAGALLHVWNHGFFKSMLFLSAGSVLHATGTREMSRMGGLWQNMPWSTGIFAFGAAAISALPPLNGFVSEWLVYLGLLEAAGDQSSSFAAIPAIISLAMAGALALAGFIKAASVVFLGAPRTRAAAAAHECCWKMRAPMIALAAACSLIAIAPGAAWPLLKHPLETWNPLWAGSDAPAPLITLGVLQVVVALTAAASVLLLWNRAKVNGIRRGPTWDCGYASPTPRIQYTGGSFSSLISGWFAWVLRPERKLNWPRGPFPRTSSHTERIPETVLEKVIGFFGAFVLSVSEWVRRRQQGHLPDYILYLVAGLVAMGTLVYFGN